MTAGVEQAELPQTAPKAGSARVLRPALGLLLPVALAVFWEIAVRMGLSNGRLVPPPSVIWNTFADLAATGELEQHAFATLSRVGWGFVFGVAAGTIFGAIAGYSALTYRLLDPTLQGLRAVPSIAWVPLFILWFGIFEASKIILIAVGVFFPVYLGVMGAVMSVDRKIVEVGRAFRLSGLAMVRRILLPAVMPAYVISLRAGLGLGWMFVLAAEFLGASTGLGFLLIDGQQLGKPAQIVAAIVAFAILGKASDWLVVLVSSPFLRWEDRAARRWGDRDARAPSRRRDLSQRRARHRRHLDRGRARRNPRRHRRLRLRQVDHAAGDLRPRHADPGPGAARRHGDHGAAREDRHHLPGAAAVALAARRRQCRLRPRPLPEGGAARAGRRRARACRAHREGAGGAARASRRQSAARRHRAGAGAAAAGAAARRAVLGARRLHPRRPAGSPARPVGRCQADVGDRDPRRRGSDRA